MILQVNGKVNKPGTKRKAKIGRPPINKKIKITKKSSKNDFDYENADENEEYEVFFF